MGFFSFLTSDTNESIPNRYSGKEVRTVYFLQPSKDGKPAKPITEDAYKGYGVFGDVDCMVWVAEHNLAGCDGLSHEEKRNLGIGLLYSDGIDGDNSKLEYPLKFSFDKNAVYEDLPAAKDCRQQGYFYGGWDFDD